MIILLGADRLLNLDRFVRATHTPSALTIYLTDGSRWELTDKVAEDCWKSFIAYLKDSVLTNKP